MRREKEICSGRMLRQLTACLLFLWIYSISYCSSARQRLNDYVTHYEEVHYDQASLHEHHSRTRRSVNPTFLHIRFHAHGRHFNMKLKRDRSIFTPDFKLETSSEGEIDHDLSHIYSGELWGQPGSRVFGSIINGSFAGQVSTPTQTYYIERADHHFRNPSFPSIIYKGEDVDHNPHRYNRLKREAENQGTCGSASPDVREWMESIQKSATPVQMEERVKRHVEREAENIYTPFERHRRATVPKRTACSLNLQSDTLLWERMVNKPNQDPAGLGYGNERAREEITSLFASLVEGVKAIFEKVQFGDYRGITFVVRRVKINETDACSEENKNKNPFCQRNVDVTNFLNLNSMQNHDQYCLAYVFTYRDFTGGTLGLAWVGSPSGQSGGICEKYRDYTETTATGASRKVWKSLNTGIVTLVNYRSPVPLKVSTLTFAHEMGHNFGSPHDSGSRCTSNREDGNFIMFASATSGDKDNNNKFSLCSTNNMTRVLKAVFEKQFGKANCFVEPQAAYCGNKIVEEGEQCDCGFYEDCNDKCCIARDDPAAKGDEAKFCTRSVGSQCSPTEGPCCTTMCQFREITDNYTCSSDTECKESSTCNGTYAGCPKSASKTDKTPCNDNTQVCLSGECKESICKKIDWEQCYVQVEDDKKKTSMLCHVACKNPDTSACIDTGDEVALQDDANKALRDLLNELNEKSIKLPPGAPCNNFQGYCDVFQKCRSVDAEGPLLRLKNLLFSSKTFTTIRDWIVGHWWAVLLIGVGVVVLMGVFIQVCAVHTPSSNPKKPPPRKISLKPRRQRQQGPPPPYGGGQNRGGPPHGRGARHNRPDQIEMRTKNQRV